MTETKKRSAREWALIILKRVTEEQAYAHIVLDQSLEKSNLSDLDKALVTELVYGTLQYLNQMDWIIGQFSSQKIKKIAPWIKNILRMGIYQLMYLDHIPPHAIVNEAVKLAKKYGHAGTVRFVNGVLRSIVRQKDDISYPDIKQDPIAHIAYKYAHPEWLVQAWVKELGIDETISLCKANNDKAPLVLRTNTLRTTREALKEQLAAEGVETIASKWTPEGLNVISRFNVRRSETFGKGLFQVQDESSQLVAHLLNPHPDEFIIDSCSAPGGKTTHIAQLMENKGQILAFDIQNNKLSLVAQSTARLGITIVETKRMDAKNLPHDFSAKADRVLVDAPCSGLGIIRRKPDIKWQKDREQLDKLPKLQLEILSRAAECVRPGGCLVYSTCTLNPAENQGVIKSFLNLKPDFQLVLPPAEWPQEEGMVHLFPHRHGTDGFFMAKMRRKEDCKVKDVE